MLGGLGRLHEGIGVIEIGEKIARSQGYVGTLIRALNNRSAYQQKENDSRRSTGAMAKALRWLRVGDRGGMVANIGWARLNS